MFTHFAGLTYGDSDQEFKKNVDSLIDEYTPIIQSYLACNLDRSPEDSRIGIVYGYVDWALRKAIPGLQTVEENGRRSFGLGSWTEQQQEGLFGVLRQAEARARRALGLSTSHPPKFHYIGLTQLCNVLNNLIEVEPAMPGFLCGRAYTDANGTVRGRFTYDSPKFVEAIIRLARGDTAHLAAHPVIRIDDDAVVTGPSIDRLLEVFADVSTRKPFYFFSGKYGRADGKPDPVNNYAVRVHWFYPEGAVAGDDRFESADAAFEKGNQQSHQFLVDLSALGATECTGAENQYSSALNDLLDKGALAQSERPSSQVISGAGLIMSRRAIELLPPFMNFDHLTTWVDDHLKRRLHETLGDIAPSDWESVVEAPIQQDRHKKGIQGRDIEWASNLYFDRLLRGCMLHAIITEPDGSATPYSKLIRDIALFKTAEFGHSEKSTLRNSLYSIAEKRYTHALRCWSSREFEGSVLHDWSRTRDAEHMKTQCDAVADDALGYIDLLLNWHVFTRAIDRLTFIENDWLYEPVE